MSHLKSVVTLSFVFLLSLKASAQVACADLYLPIYLRATIREAVIEQLFVRPSLVRRYSEDPSVVNLTYDILNSRGRLLNSSGRVQVGTLVHHKKSNLAELDVFHLKIPGLVEGEVSKLVDTSFAKVSVGIGLAIETLLEEGATAVNLKLSAIVNRRLLEQLIERLSENQSFMVNEEIMGFGIQLMIYAPEQPAVNF